MTAPGDHPSPGILAGEPEIVIVGDRTSMTLLDGLVDATVRGIVPGHPDLTGPSLERALHSMRTGVVVVVIPPADGPIVEYVAALRRERSGIRIVLVDRDAAADVRLTALEAGYDEALPRQLGVTEIAGRVAIQLARARSTTLQRLPVGAGVELDLEARALRRHGRLVHLRPLEFRLLEELARAPGRPLDRTWLLDRAWAAAPPTGSRTLDVHVRWLREKVERDPDRPVHILTVRGVGYLLDPGDPDIADEPTSSPLGTPSDHG